MRLKSFVTGILRHAALVAALAGGVAVCTPAMAGGYHDRIHADSFGNLIIHSPSGYKRIVVGQGHLARELSEYTRAGTPDVVYLEEREVRVRAPRRCRTDGVLLHGRSYMYGLPDNVVPVLEHPCP